MRFEPLLDTDWPHRSPPDPRGKPSPFRATWSSTVELLNREIGFLDGRNPVIQVAVDRQAIRMDGTYPRADANPRHPGVIVSFDSKYGPLRYVAGEFRTWQSNVRAIALGLESLRRVDRYGITKDGQQYTGWRALPAGPTGDPMETILEWSGLDPSASAEAHFRDARRRVHPDAGGTTAAFIAVQRAGADLGMTT